MSTHRLAALKHHEVLFERHMEQEQVQPEPDREAMHFFETQRERTHDLIIEIEGTAISKGAQATLEAGRQDAKARLETIDDIRASA